MTSVNTKKGAVDFRGGEEGMDDINEDDEELDDSSFALRDRSLEEQFVTPDEDPDMTIYFTSPK
jgi:hypothetical protein